MSTLTPTASRETTPLPDDEMQQALKDFMKQRAAAAAAAPAPASAAPAAAAAAPAAAPAAAAGQTQQKQNSKRNSNVTMDDGDGDGFSAGIRVPEQPPKQPMPDDGDVSEFARGLNVPTVGDIDTRSARSNRKIDSNTDYNWVQLKDPDTRVEVLAEIIGLSTKRKTHFGALFPSNNELHPGVERAFWLDGTQYDYQQAYEDYSGPGPGDFIPIGTDDDLRECRSIEDFELNAVFTMPWGKSVHHWSAYGMAKAHPKRKLKLFSKGVLVKKFRLGATEDMMLIHMAKANQTIPMNGKKKRAATEWETIKKNARPMRQGPQEEDPQTAPEFTPSDGEGE